MAMLYRSPFGNRGDADWGIGADFPPERKDEHPRSLPEDRSEGNLNPDPALWPWEKAMERGHASHAPSGDPPDDDGAGNPSPREVLQVYGQEDADQGDLGAT